MHHHTDSRARGEDIAAWAPCASGPGGPRWNARLMLRAAALSGYGRLGCGKRRGRRGYGGSVTVAMHCWAAAAVETAVQDWRVGDVCPGADGPVVAFCFISISFAWKGDKSLAIPSLVLTEAVRSSSLASLPSMFWSIRLRSSSSRNARSSRIFMIDLSSLTLLIFSSSLAPSTSLSLRLSWMHFR